MCTKAVFCFFHFTQKAAFSNIFHIKKSINTPYTHQKNVKKTAALTDRR
jgi:hypothetical protein